MIIIILIFFLIVLFFLFRLYFRRDPERNIPQDSNGIIAPADGIINYIGKAEDEFVKGLKKTNDVLEGLDASMEYLLISIFMRLWDVHVQRVPISGKVISIKHVPGKLLPVGSIQAGFLNEKVETIFETSLGLIKVVQIAGIIARRIDNFLVQRYDYKQGDRLGMIHFGSRVNILIPSDMIKKTACSTGNKVYAGESIIARY